MPEWKYITLNSASSSSQSDLGQLALPPRLESHTSVAFPAASSETASPHSLLVFGGRTNPFNPLSSVYLITPEGESARCVRVETSQPAPALFRHSAVLCGPHMIVFGGKGAPADPGALTVDSREILEQDHGAAAEEKNANKGSTYGDVWVLDTSRTPMAWTNRACSGDAPSPRHSHTAFMYCPLSLACDLISVHKGIACWLGCCWHPGLREIIPCFEREEGRMCLRAVSVRHRFQEDMYVFGGFEAGTLAESPFDVNLYRLHLKAYFSLSSRFLLFLFV